MVKGPANESMAAYTYDSRNRLTKVLDLTYEYDAENNRTASTDEQTKKTIRYIHNTNSDLSQLLVEEDGTSTTKYVYGNELICAKTYEKSLEELKQGGEGENKQSGRQQADKTYYFHYDNLKSTTLLTDATGNVVETYDYGTYGEVTSGDTTLTRFLYNGGLGVSSDNNGLYYMRARYYNPVIRRFINQDVETGSMDDSASLNRYAYVQGNPVSLTDPFGLSPDMELGNYEANALKRLFNVADKVADFLPVVGTARDIKRSYNAFKNGNIADGIKYGASDAISLVGPTAKLASKGLKTVAKLAKNSLKAEKCLSKIAQIASEGIKLAGKAVRRVGDAGKKIAKTVKNGVSTVARTVKREAIKFHKNNRGIINLKAESRFGKKRGRNEWKDGNNKLSSQIQGNSYDITKLQKTQPYTVPSKVTSIKELIVQNGPNAVPPIPIRVHHEQVLVVDGHHRLEAFRQLGYDRVPIKYVHSSQLGKIQKNGDYYNSLQDLLDGARLCD